MTITRREFKSLPAAVAIALLVFASAAFAQDTTDAPMQRADALLRQMTVEEKVMQLSSVFPLALFTIEGPNQSQLDALLKNGIGHVSALGLIGHKTPEQLAKSVNAIQRYHARR